MRRSSRKGVSKAKQRVKEILNYEDLPDQQVLASVLPPSGEKISKKVFNRTTDRLKPEKRISLALHRPRRENKLVAHSVGPMARHILFLNLGDERILEEISGKNPAWTNVVTGLSTRGGTKRTKA